MKLYLHRLTRAFICINFLIIVALAAEILVGKSSVADWRRASRKSAGIAPDPKINKEAIVQVYAARVFSWRGACGVHTWIATKPTNVGHFTVYEVVGWRVRGVGDALVVSTRPADGRWYGNAPKIISDIRGKGVDDVINKIDLVAHTYHYRDTYTV